MLSVLEVSPDALRADRRVPLNMLRHNSICSTLLVTRHIRFRRIPCRGRPADRHRRLDVEPGSRPAQGRRARVWRRSKCARRSFAEHVERFALCLQFVYTGSMAAETTTVRVRRPDSERLQSLAKARQTAVVDVVHAAIDALERQEFLRGLNGDYQRLRNDPELWEQYLAERHEWDALA